MIHNKTKIKDMLCNMEAQYGSLESAVDYVLMIDSTIEVEAVRVAYNKYMSYCINNDLI